MERLSERIVGRLTPARPSTPPARRTHLIAHGERSVEKADGREWSASSWPGQSGLVPADHFFECICVSRRAPGLFDPGAWMPGTRRTRPGMTAESQLRADTSNFTKIRRRFAANTGKISNRPFKPLC